MKKFSSFFSLVISKLKNLTKVEILELSLWILTLIFLIVVVSYAAAFPQSSWTSTIKQVDNGEGLVDKDYKIFPEALSAFIFCFIFFILASLLFTVFARKKRKEGKV
jgi:hypothetical protein